MTSSPLWRGGGRIFPNSPDENFTQKVNRRCTAPAWPSILSQLAREGRLTVVDASRRRCAEDQAAGAEAQGHGPDDSVLVITDSSTTTCFWPRATCPTCWCVEPRHADPLSLMRFKKVLVTKGAVEQFEEMLA